MSQQLRWGKKARTALIRQYFIILLRKSVTCFKVKIRPLKRLNVKCYEYMNNTQNTSNQPAINGTSPGNGIFSATVFYDRTCICKIHSKAQDERGDKVTSGARY